jgi:hypothetical protein
MIKNNEINFNNKKRVIAVIATIAAATILFIGVTPSSYQQTTTTTPTIPFGFITSAMIADNTIVSADLKDGQAVKSVDIVDSQHSRLGQ